tara:strand:- start:1296 stop:3101 length:1806 start_codon:yes stop_codon:yes gene_type:complete
MSNGKIGAPFVIIRNNDIIFLYLLHQFYFFETFETQRIKVSLQIMSFADAVRSNLGDDKTLGWNEAVEYTRKGIENDTVALFYKLVRGLSREEIFQYFEDITKNKNVEKIVELVVLTFQTRATRGIGKGERKLFYDMFMSIQKYIGKNVVMELAHLIPKYGYYKDYLYIMTDPLCSTELYNHCKDILCDRISIDYANLLKKEEVSILAKYMPREKGEFSKIACEIADKMFDGPKFTKLKKYRKMVSELNLNGIKTTTETFMCGKRYREIDFAKVSSVCMHRNRKAFLNEKLKGSGLRSSDEDRMTARDNLLSAKKLKGGELFPYEVCRSCMERLTSGSEVFVLDKQWIDLRTKMLELMKENGVEPDNTVVMSDVSGSMTMNNNVPLLVSISLGILFSELCNQAYKDLVLTFDSNPIFYDLSDCENIYKKVQKLMGAPWGGSTNILKAMELILNVAITNKVDKIPNLLIISDMQFDCAVYNTEDTHYKLFEDMFEKAGRNIGKEWKMPKITFWNVNASTKGFPTKASQPNTYLMSGFSPALFKYMFTNDTPEEETPEDMFQRIISDPNFDDIREKLSNIKEGIFAHYHFEKSSLSNECMLVE